ncbi:MAG: nucleotidyltransferase domain-containing protein [Tissierellales bacterium]
MKPLSLGDALFTKTQQKLLGLLYSKPDQSFYLNELVRLAGMGKGTVKRELDRMYAAGIVTCTARGNQHHYQANPKCPIYKDLQSIVRKTVGVADVLALALMPISEQIDFAFVYGSIAKGEAKADSDIDLMVITDTLAYADLMAVLSDAEQILRRPVNPTVYSLVQFNDRRKGSNAFITRVMEQPKIWIKGNENGIGEAE